MSQSHELCGALRDVVHPAGKVLLVTAPSRSDAAALKAGLESAPAALKALRECSQELKQKAGRGEGGAEREEQESGPPAAKKVSVRMILFMRSEKLL